DGIRAFHVTGVQTCALPIYDGALRAAALVQGHVVEAAGADTLSIRAAAWAAAWPPAPAAASAAPTSEEAARERQLGALLEEVARSEERRVGKECIDMGEEDQ